MVFTTSFIIREVRLNYSNRRHQTSSDQGEVVYIFISWWYKAGIQVRGWLSLMGSHCSALFNMWPVGSLMFAIPAHKKGKRELRSVNGRLYRLGLQVEILHPFSSQSLPTSREPRKCDFLRTENLREKLKPYVMSPSNSGNNRRHDFIFASFCIFYTIVTNTCNH